MKPTAFFLAILFSSQGSFGQPNSLKIKRDPQGSIREFIVPDSISTFLKPISFFKEYLKIKSGDEFVKIQSINNSYSEHYEQYFKGVKVRYGEYNFHSKNNRIILCNGNYIKFNDIEVIPSISVDQLKNLYAKFLNEQPQNIIRFESELLIDMIPNKNGTKEPKLLYKVLIIDENIGFNDISFMDAHTGEIIKTEPLYDNLSATGTFSTRYSGTQNATTEFYNNFYNLNDYTRPGNIHTWDAHNTNPISDPREITDLNNIWTTQELPNNLDMGLDVHWAMQKIYDHFVSRYVINSYDNQNHIISNYIRVVFNTGGKDNSGFSSAAGLFSFGEGQNKYRPIASLDAVAHEYGHAITYSQINYVRDDITQQSFNEGLSDIWAAILEYRIRPNNVWKIGEQIDLNYGCIRNIQVPHDNNARINMADTYQSTYFNNNLDVYIRSGIFSHWFYLLVNGGTGVNERGNSYNVYGIGMNAAEDIIKHCVYDDYLDNSARYYDDIREQVCNAVEYYYGANSIELQQVKNAWYAVGVGTSEPQMAITRTGGSGGNNFACRNDNLTFTVSNAPVDYITSKNWSSNCLNLVSGNNTNTCVFQVNSNCGGSGNVVNLTITSANGSVTNLTAPIQWIGAPSMVSISGPSIAKIYNGYSFYAYANYSNGTSYNWWTSPTNSYVYPYTPNMANIYFNSQGGYTVYAQAYNACGQNTPLGKFVMVTSTGLLSISPNPADEILNVSINNEQPIIIDSSDVDNSNSIMINSAVNAKSNSYTISISDNLGMVVYNTTKNSNNFSVPIGNLKNGNYILLVTDGVNKYDSHFIVNHK